MAYPKSTSSACSGRKVATTYQNSSMVDPPIYKEAVGQRFDLKGQAMAHEAKLECILRQCFTCHYQCPRRWNAEEYRKTPTRRTIYATRTNYSWEIGTMSVRSGFKIAAAYNKKTFMGHPANKIIHGLSYE